MGYRIEYDNTAGKYEITAKKKTHLPRLAAVWLVLFLVLTWNFWPEGADVLREFLIPGDEAVTIQALDMLTTQLKAGIGLKEAVTAFCREVIDGANISN